MNPQHLLELIGAVLVGRRPDIPTYSLCLECKRNGIPCVMVTRGEACLGPVTQAGCGALCPASHRGCYGCFGPSEQPNMVSMGDRLTALGSSARDVKRLLRSFNGYLEPFKQASDHHEQLEKHPA